MYLKCYKFDAKIVSLLFCLYPIATHSCSMCLQFKLIVFFFYFNPSRFFFRIFSRRIFGLLHLQVLSEIVYIKIGHVQTFTIQLSGIQVIGTIAAMLLLSALLSPTGQHAGTHYTTSLGYDVVPRIQINKFNFHKRKLDRRILCKK